MAVRKVKRVIRVWVDFPVPVMRSRRWPFDDASHMFSNDLDALHAMARRIGLKRRWFQDDPRLAHYDLTWSKWRQAREAGAVLVKDRKEVVNIWRRLRGEAPL